MSIPEKRFCRKCKVERPIEAFYRSGQLPTKKSERNVCTLDHTDPLIMRGPTVTSPKKARRKQKRILKRKIYDAYPVEIYRINTKRNRKSNLKAQSSPENMTRKEYLEYLKSDHWINFKEQYSLNPATKQECFVCGNTNYQLHHRSYARLGEEEIADIVPLCASHHKATHSAAKSGRPLDTAHLWVRQRFLEGKLEMKVYNAKDLTAE